ncbi:uncharacterized protein MELLADRAFT_89921 [Melampsora larici-populina 98AG31]|uniref:Uncharacterized protein n=1 Tax=Melampsora larici-populina (strain 98AG31 / pathotype 3-4-7) TaxID=747676 RepID=F4RV43_MELLP|nr:uncharacterized protein MELLADRAFT_89921 [Melampsora larici-populina 98AG31]EGG03816.1 hypothetical protein MELLADRAFT_89921 [Melampsora larici-populina 98AG31]
MTDTPTRSGSKSHRKRFEPILTRESARVNEKQVTFEGHQRGDMLPPPPPPVAVGRVPQSPGKFSSTVQRSRFASSPSVTIMMESPSNRPESPNGRRSRESDKTRQPDRAYERHSSANTEAVPTTSSRRAGSASLKKPGITLYTNEERKKRKRMERGIVSPSPRKMTHQQISYVDSVPQSPPRRPRYSTTNSNLGMMEASSHPRMTPPLFRDEDYEVKSENEGQEMAKVSLCLEQHSQWREYREVTSFCYMLDALDEIVNSNQVDDITPYMSEDGEPFGSSGENWHDGQDDVNFRDESQISGSTFDKYPDLSAGLAMGPQLTRAHLPYSEMSLDERTKSCQLLMDRFSKTAQDGQDILKQKIDRMDTCMERIDERLHQLNIRQQQIEARREHIRVGVQAVISGPKPE